MSLLSDYKALSTSSPRASVTSTLQAVVDAQPFSFDQSSRAEFIQLLLEDLKPPAKSRVTSKDVALALLAVKTLGKIPTGSQCLAANDNLTILLSLATTTAKDDPDASNEALRCIANALLLHESARTNLISKEVGGGEICAGLLDRAASPDQIFIVARILFLCTAANSPSFIQTLVEEKRNGKTIVEIITSKLEASLVGIQSGQKFSKEAMTDLLKFTFNLLVRYPKIVESEPQNSEAGKEGAVMGDYWSSKLDGLLPQLLRIFHSLPPTFPSPLVPPLTHIIHALISIPITPLRTVWFPPQPVSRSSNSSNSGSGSPKTTQPPGLSSGSGQPSASSSRSDSPTTKDSPPPPRAKPLDRALSAISRSLSRSPSPTPHAVQRDTFLYVHDLLEVALSHYFPDACDVDDLEVRAKINKELQATIGTAETSVDEVLSPLVVLMTRFCEFDQTSRQRARQWIVPNDLDRTAPLETRADTLGRCIRLMGSVYHARLKDAIGEMVFAICDSDASTLSVLFGYGNVAGFLFNKGIMSAPPAPSGSGVSDVELAEDINPITGVKSKPQPEGPEMTEEEKEREMDKLFVLFDRLERSGAIPPEHNPVRTAIQKSMQQ